MSSKKEIALSVEDTNALRAKLGLKPLKVETTKVSGCRGFDVTGLTSDGFQKEEEEVNGGNGDKEESSLSVEETNKLRAKLGLKPLNDRVGQKSGKVIDKPPEVVDERTLEAQARIERSRKRRKLKEKIGTHTLGEGEHTSAAAWLQKSSKRQKEAMLAIEREEAMKEEEAAAAKASETVYDASQLSGIKLSHDLAEHVKEGEQVILTLKDSELIDKKTGELVEGKVDELENAYIAEGERYRKKRQKEKLIKQSKQSYVGLDEDDDGTSKTLLGKYDIDEKSQEAKAAGVIDASGVVRFSGDGSRKKESGPNATPSLMSVAAQNLGVLGETESDFLTLEESQANEKKVKKKKLKKRKRKKASSKRNAYRPVGNEADMIGDVEEAATVEDVVSKKLKGQRARTAAIATASDEEETDDMGLQEALSKARKALKRRRVPESESFDMDDTEEGQGHIFKSTPASEADGSAESRFLTGATEFSSSIEHSVDTIRSANSGTAIKQESSSTEVSELTTRAEEAKVPIKEEPGVEKKPEAQHVTDLLSGDKKLAGGGMAAALAAFKSAGDVIKVPKKEKKQKTVVKAKRGKDFNFKDIDLTYRDKSGKILTTKEAYLELCYKFHGIKPGKRSIAKKKRKEEQSKRTQNMGLGDTPLGTASALRRVQAKTGAAFIKLDTKDSEET